MVFDVVPYVRNTQNFCAPRLEIGPQLFRVVLGRAREFAPAGELLCMVGPQLLQLFHHDAMAGEKVHAVNVALTIVLGGKQFAEITGAGQAIDTCCTTEPTASTRLMPEHMGILPAVVVHVVVNIGVKR